MFDAEYFLAHSTLQNLLDLEKNCSFTPKKPQNSQVPVYCTKKQNLMKAYSHADTCINILYCTSDNSLLTKVMSSAMSQVVVNMSNTTTNYRIPYEILFVHAAETITPLQIIKTSMKVDESRDSRLHLTIKSNLTDTQSCTVCTLINLELYQILKKAG